MLAALAWVPKGAAKTQPVTAEPTAEELEAIAQQDGSCDARYFAVGHICVEPCNVMVI